MRIAVVKPDWRIRGGFEIVVDAVVADLTAAGHEVDRVEVDVPALPHAPFGVTVADTTWATAPEWFGHMGMLAHFRELDLSGYDLVLSTQPPSYAVRHPRHLALFYHHARSFYDLSDIVVRAGRSPAALHEAAGAMLRAAEAPDLAGVTHFLAGSPRVAERLRQFQGEQVSVSLYQAPAPVVDGADAAPGTHALVVSRHEFTKRTELAVAALALGDVPGVLVGAGGRLPVVAALSAGLAAGDLDAATLGPEDLWLNGDVPQDRPEGGLAHVRLAGRVDDDELDGLYRGALCLVAPAYDEDHGLTVLEAMARGRPVVVCRDGGGLTAAVEDGVNGFVVDPEPAAIAAAVARLAADPALARRMGEAALETAAQYTAERARTQLLEAVARVGDSR